MGEGNCKTKTEIFSTTMARDETRARGTDTRNTMKILRGREKRANNITTPTSKKKRDRDRQRGRGDDFGGTKKRPTSQMKRRLVVRNTKATHDDEKTRKGELDGNDDGSEEYMGMCGYSNCVDRNEKLPT